MIDPKDPVPPPDEEPVEQSLEEAALDRVREHLADLQAQTRLGEELADPAAPSPSPAPAPPKTREEADAEALAEFQRLRERASKKTL